jgi:hypothetical protein
VDGPRRPSPLRRPRNVSAHPRARALWLSSRFRSVPQSCSLHSAETYVLSGTFQVLCGDDGAVAGERRGVIGNFRADDLKNELNL